MDNTQAGNLLFENFGGLFHLSVAEAGAQHVVEAVEIMGHLAAALHVEGALELTDQEQRVIDFPGAGFDVALLDRRNGSPQVGDGLLVEKSDELHGACALHCRFAIRESCVHIVYSPEVRVGWVLLDVLEPKFELMEPRVSVTNCSNSGYDCREEFTLL